MISALAVAAFSLAAAAFGTWEFFEYKSSTIYAVQMLAANDGWAVGAGGGIWRYNGYSWQAVPTPTDKDLRAICMLSASEGWAVGNNGTIIRYNGTSWTTVTSPATEHLYCLDFTASGSGWAGGRNGVLLRCNGNAWTAAASPTSRHINGLDMVSATNGWLVTNGGFIYRYNGTSWQAVTSPTANDHRAVKARGATTAFACGAYQTILFWNGGSWQVESTGPVIYNLNALAAVDAGDVWAMGGEGVAMHRVGTTWFRNFTPWNIETYGVSFVGPFDGWAVAAGGVVWRYTSATAVSPSSLGRVKVLFH